MGESRAIHRLAQVLWLATCSDSGGDCWPTRGLLCRVCIAADLSMNYFSEYFPGKSTSPNPEDCIGQLSIKIGLNSASIETSPRNLRRAHSRSGRRCGRPERARLALEWGARLGMGWGQARWRAPLLIGRLSQRVGPEKAAVENRLFRSSLPFAALRLAYATKLQCIKLSSLLATFHLANGPFSITLQPIRLASALVIGDFPCPGPRYLAMSHDRA